MDDFPGLLARDFGFKPQGKSAPMAPQRTSFGVGSGNLHRSSSKSNSIFDDHDRDNNGLLFTDVFGGPPRYTSAPPSSDSLGTTTKTASSSAFDYDSIFRDQNNSSAGAGEKSDSVSPPIFDKPVYDDDIFDGLPGIKSSPVSNTNNAKYEDVFASISSPSSRRKPQSGSPFDDLLGNLGKREAESKSERVRVDQDSTTVFDDLLPGFRGSSSSSINRYILSFLNLFFSFNICLYKLQRCIYLSSLFFLYRSTSESSRFQKSASTSTKTASGVLEDPFSVLESTSAPAVSSPGVYTDPLEEISKFGSSGNTRVEGSSVSSVFDDIDPLDSLGKSVPPVSFEVNERGRDRSPSKSGGKSGAQSSTSKEPMHKSPVESADSHSQNRMRGSNLPESPETLFDMPNVSTDFRRSVSPPSYMSTISNERNTQANRTPRSEEIFESSDDVWLTVSEIPLFTQPSSAPPPSRPPPPRPTRVTKSETGSFSSTNVRKKVNEFSAFPNSTQYTHSPKSAHAASQIDELEDFAMGRSQNNVHEQTEVLSGDDLDSNSVAAASAAAMKEAMDRAEAKFRHAKERREREYLKTARSKESVQQEKDEMTTQDASDIDLREKQERLDRERQQREREEEEREQRRLEKEREKEDKERRLERERMEKERGFARQAVERATREARERAAAEARLKAERAAVGKASAEARERAERAAVQRVQAEARERAATEARERAERAATEARERAERAAAEARAESREREARDRVRAERASVERAAAEARERAAADARERAAAAARASQQKNENDLESFFSMGSRASSAPRPRANSSDPMFDGQSKVVPETVRRTSVSSSNMKKASSTTNIVDDLSSIFGVAASSSGEFQDVEGETEDRRRARLERHQRTQERAAKALAEKNERDLQAQREQAERHRLAETLDVEIKRWAAGKEGNLRALLSTLQYVLWPECGWQPVSLTDLITGAAVKKVYRKATLCIHPDKVQQKGANLQQKYVAEKVFDLLKVQRYFWKLEYLTGYHSSRKPIEMKRKTPLQYQALENLYSENKYPTHGEMEDCGMALGLTYKEVRGWFVEKRRRDKMKNGAFLPPSLSEKLSGPADRIASETAFAKKILKHRDSSSYNRTKNTMPSASKYKHISSTFENGIDKRKKTMICLQELLNPQYILRKIFRKDGPPLGVEFDSAPSSAFLGRKGILNLAFFSPSFCLPSKWRVETFISGIFSSLFFLYLFVFLTIIVTRVTYMFFSTLSHLLLPPPSIKNFISHKVSKHSGIDHQDCNEGTTLPKKHGIGKGLMTVWRVTNPDGGDFPTGTDASVSQVTIAPQASTHVPGKQLSRKKRPPLVSVMVRHKNDMLFAFQVQSNKKENQPQSEKCELALEVVSSQDRRDLYAMLVDDEELELRELQAGPNLLTCSEHCSTNLLCGCSLCKDLLPKFPPNSVKMKKPFTTQPWDSSPEAVKKLFKVFHFLCTYSVTVDICPFTLDEFAQAFHDKDSLLLGKIHVALLKLLISDVETEVRSGIFPHSGVSCKFLALLHSVENQELVLEFWKKSLNPLTWTEILRQVLVAAGFGSNRGALQREALGKEMSFMVKYGLRPGTLKGELFRLLSVQGNNGSKVSELAKSFQIVELNLASSTEELELLICSTLSSDITLFEKISSSAYRLRINMKEDDNFQSDSEDSGSVDYHSNDGATCGTSDDSECDSEISSPSKRDHVNRHRSRGKMLTVHNEIDESNPGEVWLLGLMEGEYSDLSVEEMLNALVALIDLVGSGPSITLEVLYNVDPTKAVVEYVPNIHQHVSGAKIKRSSANQHNLPRPSWVHVGQMNSVKEAYTSSEFRPVDSASSISKRNENEKSSSSGKDTEGEIAHPMQSAFLGSDRRYNRYWLFLGPCNAFDPGHRRIYFESSEDGHWEVIDTEEALRVLLLVLDDRGRREAFLIESLEKREAYLCQAMSSSMTMNTIVNHSSQPDLPGLDTVREVSSSPVSDVDNLSLSEITKDSMPPCGAIDLEIGKKGEEQNCKGSHLQEFDAWIWNYFYLELNAVRYSKKSYLDSLAKCESCHDLYWRDEKHCRICHTTFELDFDLEERYAIHAATCRMKEDDNVSPKHKVLPSHLQSLKAAVHAIESVLPEDALLGAWRKSARRLWVKRLRRTSSLAELLQVVADFVAAINEDWLYQCNVMQSHNTFMEEITACFPTMPQTSSAVALWLVKLDELIAPYLERASSENKKDTRIRCTGKRFCVTQQ
ncbi:LOW QUALITY PROTEIN: Homeobox domain-containing protein/DDT domain-containing protein [Cephalotus follicularis]|uniref:Homeobox domain-containing protein/DDT domain-containing protein n=1 Tax=Cephalotus follicularis TaxID=3775 RepID=A0A1Q3BK61_CEPFO|nr:LOW QUALITY PROTEIN: Homeobox domain-containing protein/DDT domain-containing protein [Cephalotus follicularis]